MSRSVKEVREAVGAGPFWAAVVTLAIICAAIVAASIYALWWGVTTDNETKLIAACLVIAEATRQRGRRSSSGRLYPLSGFDYMTISLSVAFFITEWML